MGDFWAGSARLPEAKRYVARRVLEVAVGRQQIKIVAPAELDQKRVDRADLRARASADVADFGRLDVVVAVGQRARQDGESVEQALPVARAAQALQQLLDDHAGRDDEIGAGQRFAQKGNMRRTPAVVAPEGQRPDAGIDEQAHRSRLRSRLGS